MPSVLHLNQWTGRSVSSLKHLTVRNDHLADSPSVPAEPKPLPLRLRPSSKMNNTQHVHHDPEDISNRRCANSQFRQYIPDNSMLQETVPPVTIEQHFHVGIPRDDDEANSARDSVVFP